jgi:hypothetical protein
MIPKARFDEINKELKALRAAQAKAEAERVEVERKAAEEQGKYRELYEKEKAERESALAEMKRLQLQALRREVAAEAGLPAGVADRLMGETREELLADAKALLDILPRPSAPALNSGAGNLTRSNGPAASDAEIREKAAVYGVDARYWPRS